MDEKQREELAKLRREQQRLQDELAKLSGRLMQLEQRADSPQVDEQPAQEHKSPPPVPESALKSAKDRAEKAQAPADDKSTAKPERGVQAPVNDWELNLGRIWFVRAGVGLVLTGLVFLSLYAYKNWIFNATALVKVSFFFAISLAMVGGGYVLERWREHLRQYGQVLSAGGLAAGYYTIYAAHFVPPLKVIGSPVAAAILLCLWAGGMLAYASWRRGRILAVMSVGLAYYSTVVNPSGWISLFSSLVLSAAAIVLLLRHRWVWVGAVGLIAAYLSHAFWTSMVNHEVTEAVRITYLACTWLVFSLAMQVPQCKVLDQNWRRGMLGINNTAFWALLVFHIPKLFPDLWLTADRLQLQPHEHIGWISIGIGAGWMLIGALTWWRGGWRREYMKLWGFQGLLVATLGMMIEASGYSRFMMLACEACILLLAARWMAPKWTRLAAVLCFFISAVFGLLEFHAIMGDPRPGWLAYLFTSLFGFAFVALMRRDVDDLDQSGVEAFYGEYRRLAPIAFAWVPWVALLFGSVLRWDQEWQLIGLCGVPLLVATTRVFSRRREILDIALYTPLALVVVVPWLAGMQTNIPNWCFAGATFLVSAFWLISLPLAKDYKELAKAFPFFRSPWIEWTAAVVLGLILLAWLGEPSDNSMGWLLAAPSIAIAGTLVYVLTRRTSLAAILAFFHLGALVVPWAGHHELTIWQTAAPFLFLIIHLAIAEWNFEKKIVRGVRPIAGLAISLALWSVVSLHNWSQPELWMGLLAAGWIAYSFVRKDAFAAGLGGFLPMLVVSSSTLFTHDPDQWSPYPVMLILPVAALLTRSLLPDPDKDWISFRRMSGVAGLSILGIKLSLHVPYTFDGSGLAICWGLFAVLLFATGLVFIDRLFRRFGLFFLLIALIHVLLVDVMKLDTLGRILSFLTLGAVLLLLGFLYNQFQDKIRKYL